MLKFAECVAEGRPLTSFTQRDMPYLRMEIAYALYETRPAAGSGATAS